MDRAMSARIRGASAIWGLCVLGMLAVASGRSQGPVQLLVPDRNRTGLAVVESSLSMIERLEGPVAVVAITGARMGQHMPHAAAGLPSPALSRVAVVTCRAPAVSQGHTTRVRASS